MQETTNSIVKDQVLRGVSVTLSRFCLTFGQNVHPFLEKCKARDEDNEVARNELLRKQTGR